MRDWSKLDAASAEIASRDPRLQRRLQDSWQECSAAIQKEINSALGAVMVDRASTAEQAENSLGDLLMLYDMHVLQACDLSYFAWKYADSKSRTIWPGVKLPSQPAPNNVFKVVTSNLSHAMQAFRLLSIHGYDHQARNTLRNLLELMDITIAVLADRDFYLEYIRSFDNDADTQRHWQSKLKPALVRKLLEQLDASDPIIIPIDWNTVEIRKDLYGWLSKFSHNNFVSHVVASYPTNGKGHTQDLGMLGSVGGMSRATFAQALVYLWVSSIRIQRLLWQKHGWGGFRGTRNRLWTGYRFTIINEISGKYLPKFWENEPGLI